MLTTSRSALLIVALLSAATHILAIQYNDIQMLCLVNKERKKVGARPLGLNPKLTKAAYAHSKDQARTRKMSHTGSDGSNPSKRVTRAGYKWKSTAENVAYGYKSMEEVMKTWMRSPGHKRNILDKQSTQFGSGYAMAGSTAYFTQVFASGETVDPASIPKCDGSDTAYGGAAGGDQYGEDMTGEEDMSGGDYAGGDDAGDSSGGTSMGGMSTGVDYSGGDDYSGGNDDSDSGDKYGSRGGKRSRGSKRSGDDYSGDESDSGDKYGSRGGKRSRGDKRSRDESDSGDKYGSRGGKRSRGGKNDSENAYGSSKKGRRGGRRDSGDSQDY